MSSEILGVWSASVGATSMHVKVEWETPKSVSTYSSQTHSLIKSHPISSLLTPFFPLSLVPFKSKLLGLGGQGGGKAVVAGAWPRWTIRGPGGMGCHVPIHAPRTSSYLPNSSGNHLSILNHKTYHAYLIAWTINSNQHTLIDLAHRYSLELTTSITGTCTTCKKTRLDATSESPGLLSLLHSLPFSIAQDPWHHRAHVPAINR